MNSVNPIQPTILPGEKTRRVRVMRRFCSGCKRGIGNCIFDTCNKCRADKCTANGGHTNFHYDASYAKICDDCGTVVVAAKNKQIAHTIKQASEPCFSHVKRQHSINHSSVVNTSEHGVIADE